jgi:hypothetical protein
VAALKQAARPLNMKVYNKEKRRLLRARFPSIFSLSGFAKSFKIFYLRMFNILRILFIISIFMGIVLLIVLALIKVFKLIQPAIINL